MTDQTQRLEIATVRAEIGSDIVYHFSNDPVTAPEITTNSGEIPNLKQVIRDIKDEALDAALRQELAAVGGAQLVNLTDVEQNVKVETDDSSDTQYTLHTVRTTNQNSDTILTERVATGEDSAGYAIHALDSGTGMPGVDGGGGAIGGATSRTTPASAVVGNRRDSGAGHGGIFSRLESGQGNGAHGFRAGSGAGDGVFGYIIQTAQGHGVHGKHEGAISGAGVYGERLNGAGVGPGVMGHAAGAGGAESASGFFFKLADDTAPAILADARGSDPAVRAFAAVSATAKAIESQTDVTDTAPISNTFDRDYSLAGTNMRLRTGAGNGGARTALVQGIDISVSPGATSTGTSPVYGINSLIGSSVTGSTDSRCASFNNNSIGGTDSYAFLGVVNGANTRNYAVYGNAVGGTTNWSGYFVGNVFYGGTLTPSDSRLKDIHGEVDYAKCLENVLANPIYSYDKYSAWMEPTQVYGEVEDREGNLIIPTFGEHEARQVVAVGEVGNLAQDIQKTNPEFITEYSVGETRYLSVSDRSELFQLKAAVKYLVERLRDAGIEV